MPISVKLRTENEHKGLSPLTIRISRNSKTVYHYLDISLKESQWKTSKELNDESDSIGIVVSHPQAIRYNKHILQTFKDAERRYNEIEEQFPDIGAKEMKELIFSPAPKLTLKKMAKEYLEAKKKNKSFIEYRSQGSRIKILFKYINDTLYKREIEWEEVDEILLKLQEKDFIDIPFEKLTKEFIEGFISSLDIGERSKANHLILIRTLFNQAIGKGLEEKYYPFGKKRGGISIKIPKSTNKVGLDENDIKKWEWAMLKEQEVHDRNALLLSFSFGGMRIGDALTLTWDSIKDGRNHYTMGKTNEPGSLKISNRAQSILDFYEKEKDHTGLILPHLKKANFKDEEEVSKRINSLASTIRQRSMKVFKQIGIDKKISGHVMRHTFGNVSSDKIPVQVLQKIYRHQDINTTINYQQNFIHKEADEAIDKVVDF